MDLDHIRCLNYCGILSSNAVYFADFGPIELVKFSDLNWQAHENDPAWSSPQAGFEKGQHSIYAHQQAYAASHQSGLFPGDRQGNFVSVPLNTQQYTIGDLARLSGIGELLDHPATDHHKQLLEQRMKLDAHITRLHQIRARLDNLINEQESQSMSTDNRFAVFDGFDPDQYEEEVKARWGDTDAYQESTRRAKKYNSQGWASYKSESAALNQSMSTLMARGLAADDQAVLEVVEKMRMMIDTWFYPCSRQMHANLGEMYVQDERFTETYEKIRPGMAQFMRDATAANHFAEMEKNQEGQSHLIGEP